MKPSSCSLNTYSSEDNSTSVVHLLTIEISFFTCSGMLQYSLKKPFKSFFLSVLLLLPLAFDISDTIPETKKLNFILIGQIPI